MEQLELLAPYILPLALSYITYLYGKGKTKAEIANLELSAEEKEIDVMDKSVDFYRDKVADLLAEVAALKKQVTNLERLLENLTLNQCLGDSCSTKVEYDKIMTKRAARKKYTLNKKNENKN
jgi:hypothetical protein